MDGDSDLEKSDREVRRSWASEASDDERSESSRQQSRPATHPSKQHPGRDKKKKKDRVKQKRHHGAQKRWREKELGKAAADLSAQVAGARDARAEGLQEEDKNGSSGPSCSCHQSAADHEADRLQMEYAKDVAEEVRGRSFDFKESQVVKIKFDSVALFFTLLTIIECFTLLIELGGVSLVKAFLIKKLFKAFLLVVGWTFNKYVGLSLQTACSIVSLLTALTLGVSILEDKSMLVMAIYAGFIFTYWISVLFCAIHLWYISPFEYRTKHVYTARRVFEPKASLPEERPIAQSLTDCKLKYPLYAEVDYHAESSCRIFGIKFPYRRVDGKAGRDTTLSVSLEWVMQLMVPRVTGIELSVEQVANSIASMSKALHAIAVGRKESLLRGTIAIVMRLHQKVKHVPFHRISAINAQ